jgi:hypothetical protein
MTAALPIVNSMGVLSTLVSKTEPSLRVPV